MAILTVTPLQRAFLESMAGELEKALGYGINDGTTKFASEMGNYTSGLFNAYRTQTKEFIMAAGAAMFASGMLASGGGGGGTVTSVGTGNGLTGGPITSSGTVNIGQGDGITVGTDDIAVDSSVVRLTAAQDLTNKTITSAIMKDGLTATGSIAYNFGGSTGQFLTSTGAVSLLGDTTLAVNKNFSAASGTSAFDFSPGSGTFKTTTGAVSLAGNTTVLTGKTFSIADMTLGSIPFFGSSGLMTQDNSGIFYDNTNDRVGLGTTAPGIIGGSTDITGSKLHLKSATEFCGLIIESTIAANKDPFILLYSPAIDADSAIFIDESDNQKLKFSMGQVNTDAQRNTNAKMALTQGGVLGVGTTSPSASHIIHGEVALSTSVPFKSRNTHASGVGGYEIYNNSDVFKGQFGHNNAGGNTYIYTGASTDFNIFTNNGGSSHVFKSAGTVGLGVTTVSASNRLEVSGSATIGAYTNTAGPTNGLIVSGQVGIGTSSPTALYACDIRSADNPLKLTGTATTSFNDIDWFDSSNTYKGSVGYGNASVSDATLQNRMYFASPTSGPDWVFNYGGTIRALMQMSTGNFGIGQTSPANPLSVNGAASFGTFSATAAPANSIIVSGGIAIGTSSLGVYSFNVQTTLTADVNTSIANLSSSGYSGISWKNSSGAQQGSIGYGNISVALGHAAGTLFSFADSTAPPWIWMTATSRLMSLYSSTSGNLNIGTSTSDPSIKLNIEAATASAGIGLGNGSTLAVSGSNLGRLRYNSTGQNFQASMNGSAYDSLALLTATQEMTNKTLTAQVVKTGLTASGSASNDFSGSTGTFKTSTGAVTIGNGAITVSGTATFTKLPVANYGGTSTDVLTPSWTTPSFNNSWTDNGGTAYMKDSLGMVHIRIDVNNASPSSNNVFVLPAGFRPGASMYYPAMSSSSAGFRALYIGTDGSVDASGTADTRIANGCVIFPAEG